MALPSLLALSLALTLNASGSRSPPAKPADAALPPDELGEAVKLGRNSSTRPGRTPSPGRSSGCADAGWLRATMPPDAPLASDADAVDVAAYVNSQPRPDFVLRDHLPAGDRTGVYNSSVADEVDRAPTWPRRK